MFELAWRRLMSRRLLHPLLAFLDAQETRRVLDWGCVPKLFSGPLLEACSLSSNPISSAPAQWPASACILHSSFWHRLLVFGPLQSLRCILSPSQRHCLHTQVSDDERQAVACCIQRDGQYVYLPPVHVCAPARSLIATKQLLNHNRNGEARAPQALPTSNVEDFNCLLPERINPIRAQKSPLFKRRPKRIGSRLSLCPIYLPSSHRTETRILGRHLHSTGSQVVVYITQRRGARH